MQFNQNRKEKNTQIENPQYIPVQSYTHSLSKGRQKEKKNNNACSKLLQLGKEIPSWSPNMQLAIPWINFTYKD